MSLEKEPNVNLIGTFHMDLALPRLMEKALISLEPDILVCESNELLDVKAKTRDKIWKVLFDEFNIPPETRRKFFTLQPDKEHCFLRDYAKKFGLPFYMVDLPEPIEQSEVDNYSQKALVERIRSYKKPDLAREFLVDLVNRDFARHLRAQGGNPPLREFYDENFLITPGKVNLVGERDKYMAERIAKIIDNNPDKRITGFFGSIHVINPRSETALRLLGTPIENIRFLLGETRAKYSMIIDL